MAVGILDYRYPETRFCHLADCPVEQAHWPDGRPDRAATFGDMRHDDHLVLETRSKSLLADLRGLRCKVSAMLYEPPEIHARYYRWLRALGGRYHRVLTHNSRLLSQLPNARYFPHGGCYLSGVPTDRPAKTERVSLIASSKRYAAGHKLRHRVAEWSAEHAPDLQRMGRGFRALDKKEEGHLPFCYSVVIENSREPGYFTEKLLDSLLCWSVPIYWGAPDVAHHFDPRGMVVCHTERELHDAIRGVSVEGYAAFEPYLEANREVALRYADVWRNVATTLRNDDAQAIRRETTRPTRFAQAA